MQKIFFISINSIFAILLLQGCQNSSKHHSPHPKGMGIHHDFSDAEAWSKKFDDPNRSSWQKPDEIIQSMQIKNGETVADIGAGTGFLLPYLSQAVGSKGKVYALDVEESLIEYMTKRAQSKKLSNVTAELIPMDNPGDRMQEVDKVVILNTWHHISDRNKYGQILFDKLKAKAAVIIVEPEKGTGGPGPKDSHRTHYSQTASELTAVGFQCEQVKENMDYQYMAICKKRQ